MDRRIEHDHERVLVWLMLHNTPIERHRVIANGENLGAWISIASHDFDGDVDVHHHLFTCCSPGEFGQVGGV